MVNRASHDSIRLNANDFGSKEESPEPGRHKWVWWLLLPLILVLSIVSAYWGILHIEGQVRAAAPTILRNAGIDPSKLSFTADYRNVTVAGQLPEGVSPAKVREILERDRGSAGEDIRRAEIVAYEWIKPVPRDNAAESAIAQNAPAPIEPESTTQVSTGSVSGSDGGAGDGAVRDSAVGDSAFGDGAFGDGAVRKESLSIARVDVPPRVSVLFDGSNMTLSGTDVSKVQIDRLLAAASTSVGSTNVKQQWQAAQMPGALGTAAVNSGDIDQVAPLAALVAALGENASAASLRLENNAISGSIVASSEQSMARLKASAGDSVVVTSAVASAESSTSPDDKNKATTAPVVGQTAPAPTSSEDQAAPVEDLENAGDDAPAVDDSRVEDASVDSDSSDSGEQQTGKPTEKDLLQTEIAALQREIDALQQRINDHVFFVHDSSAITREAQPLLDKVGVAMRQYRRPSVMIEGHTDSIASREYNLSLSKRRAAAVLEFLARNGIDAKRLRSDGHGEDKPVVSNSTKPGRRLNRRVEFTAREPFADGE